MDFQTIRLFFALLAVAANVATIGIVAIGIAGRSGPRGAELRDRVFSSLAGLELWLAFSVATVATLGSLYLSEVVHLVPCTFCWYQRIAMYPLVVILGIAAWRKDHGVRVYSAAIAAIGAVIAAYHRLIQAVPEFGGSSCSTGVPCTAAYFTLFGFVTIPYMALSGFLFILALLWVDRANSPSESPSFRNV
ncbi:MAG: disulfide oxidoreductase [Actinomycetota bacterium]